ncbi:hypothetical protein Fcan01_13290 [Folsomia candida]|uniref:Uncharacterized protein n=1 Tax=Folsomia candida TaxID=158441 RepID=A0A226E2U6_FOLCA|nr:hypothetical protein Fcan01_13290 [Folsomia candida]
MGSLLCQQEPSRHTAAADFHQNSFTPPPPTCLILIILVISFEIAPYHDINHTVHPSIHPCYYFQECCVFSCDCCCHAVCKIEMEASGKKSINKEEQVFGFEGMEASGESRGSNNAATVEKEADAQTNFRRLREREREELCCVTLNSCLIQRIILRFSDPTNKNNKWLLAGNRYTAPNQRPSSDSFPLSIGAHSPAQSSSSETKQKNST